jgi:ATP-dependent helicase HrpA
MQPAAKVDIAHQLQELMGKRFIADTRSAQLQHFACSLQTFTLRLVKPRIDSAHDAVDLAELQLHEKCYLYSSPSEKGSCNSGC